MSSDVVAVIVVGGGVASVVSIGLGAVVISFACSSCSSILNRNKKTQFKWLNNLNLSSDDF